MGSITSTDMSNEPQGCYEKSDDSILFPYSHMLFFSEVLSNSTSFNIFQGSEIFLEYVLMSIIQSQYSRHAVFSQHVYFFLNLSSGFCKNYSF